MPINEAEQEISFFWDFLARFDTPTFVFTVLMVMLFVRRRDIIDALLRKPLRSTSNSNGSYVSQQGFEAAQRQNHEDHEKILSKLDEFNRTMVDVGKTISKHEEKHKSHNRRLDLLEKND